MSQPAVTITELNGALGIQSPGGGKLLAIIGTSTSGPVATPASFARVQDVTANFGNGPLVEAAAFYISRTGNPVVVVRATVAAAAVMGDLTITGAGTATPVAAGGNSPTDDFEILITFVTGGALGTTGITYTYSLDGGRTTSALQSQGTSLTLTIPNSGVSFTLGTSTQTILAGETISSACSAPNWDTTTLGAALTALGNSLIAWEQVAIVGPVDATILTQLDSKMVSLAAAGKDRWFSCNFRMPKFAALNSGTAETEAAYLTAFSTAFGASATDYGSLCAGADRVVSAVSGRQYQRPVVFQLATAVAAVTEDVDVADVNLGALPCTIRDSNGNSVAGLHDESVNPGLDDARATVLRTWDGIQGVYLNRPRIFSAQGSDFFLIPHRRVMNLAKTTVRNALLRRLNQSVQVNKTTGFILEGAALEIEAFVTAAMTATLLAKPKASAVSFVLSRTDNLLSTQTLTGQARVIPLGYTEFINVPIALQNPALAVQAG